jgi:hypothetical protein
LIDDRRRVWAGGGMLRLPVSSPSGLPLTSYALNDIFMHKLFIGRPIMRTTLDLPEDLINEAMKTTQINTKTKVIITALEDLIRKSKISGLKKFKGKVDLDIDMNAIRGR